MKIRILKPLMVVLLITATISCDDDDDTIIIEVPSYEDAQEIVALSLSYDSYGLVAQFEQMNSTITDSSECETLYEDSDVQTGAWDSGLITYQYDYTEAYTKYCEPELYVDYTTSASQLLEAVRFTATHEVTAQFVATGLEAESDSEIYNGSYERSGLWESTTDEDFYNFDYKSQVNEVFLSKETGKITSGTATFTLSETYSQENLTYSYEGTVEFLNEEEAMVTFDTGEVFYVNLNNVSISND